MVHFELKFRFQDSILEASFTKEEHGSDSDHKPFDSHLLDPIAREDNNQSGDEKTQKGTYGI